MNELNEINSVEQHNRDKFQFIKEIVIDKNDYKKKSPSFWQKNKKQKLVIFEEREKQKC